MKLPVNTEKTKMVLCPRCGLKSAEGTEKCPDCGLLFQRLDIATNKDAKRKLLRWDREFIIRTKKLPSDVSYMKLLLFTIFLGIFGGHCYYVGRYLRGIMFTVNFLFAILCVVLNNYFLTVWNGNFLPIAGAIIGFVEIFWIWDIISVALKKFKVPVAIDLTTLEG